MTDTKGNIKIRKQLQRNIAQAIKQSNMTQAEIAKEMDCSAANISQIVSCMKCPALVTFAKLCKVLHLDANDIIYATD